MIGYLHGEIRRLEPERVVVSCGGVGYVVHIPLTTYYRLEGKSEAELEIHTHVREDAISLFGFFSGAEKEAFEKLITISGIGPRLAQVILSGIGPDELADAVARGDSRRLASIPGVGKKTSERMCLELRDKLAVRGAPAAAKPAGEAAGDVVSALVNLGYRAGAAEDAVAKASAESGASEFSDLLRLSLRHLTR